MAPTFEATKHGYANLWDRATIRPEHQADAEKAAARISTTAARAAFEHVQKLTAVPWYMVGAILWRESDLNFKAYLGNGQPLNQVTTIVPKGRGPFASWYDGAADALTLQGIAGFDPKNWTIERILFWLERYNGTGYFGHAVNDPYLWSWTDFYTVGKFTTDHGFDPTAVDKQGGCVAVLKVLQAQGIITLTREAVAPAKQEPAIVTTPTPTPTLPSLPAGFDVTQIEHALQSAQAFLPMISGFLPPQIKPFVALLPILIDGLEMVKQIQSSDHSATSIATLLAEHLHSIADKMKTALPTPAQVQQIAAAPDRSGAVTG